MNVFPGSRRTHEHVGWHDILDRIGLTGLRSPSITWEEGMRLLFDSYFEEGKRPVLREVLERWRGGRGGSGRRKRKRGREVDKEFSSCSPYLQLTRRKNGSIYLPFPSIYLPSSIHQYLSFPRGAGHVWQFILLHYISIRGWRQPDCRC